MTDETMVEQEPLDKAPISDEHKKEKRIAVIETFGPVLQGEGPLAGSKTMFIRFGGCDYRCTKCDSLHAVLPAAVKRNARYLTAEEIAEPIISAAKKTGTPWVTLSGGNPLMWDLSRLIQLLKGAELAIAVETQGTLYQPWLKQCNMVVLSPKTPGMGEKFEPEKFLNILEKLDETIKAKRGVATALKMVIFSQQDIDFALEVYGLANTMFPGVIHPGAFFFSLGNAYPPKLDKDNQLVDAISNGDVHKLQLLAAYKSLTEDLLVDPRITHFCFLPQLHVLMYGNEAER
jgi:7-carboxy-7-deazaguanine synthase